MLCLIFFFFKQKTAYEMLRSLVGSEMCIRDRVNSRDWAFPTEADIDELVANNNLESKLKDEVVSLSLIHI